MSVVLFETHEATGTITINRPEALNALNSTVLVELEELLTKIETDKELRCLIITGAGEKAFVAGADIREMAEISGAEAFVLSQKGHAVFNKIESLYCPVIAAVNGFALGGGLELALACDFIIASQKAKLGLPESTLGLIPGFGGTVRLERRVGSGLAKQLMFTGSMIGAEEAHRVGLVNAIFEPANLMSEVTQLAQTICSRSPQALCLIKQSTNEAYGLDISAAMDLEAKYFSKAFNTFDQKEGTKAFIEKRPAVFKGIKEQQ
jgi:enoyl-CoA hydratase